MTNTRRKSTLFLVEQLIVIAVFALCAIACISILTTSYFMVRDSSDTANALITAQNFAEAFKLSDGFEYYLSSGDEQGFFGFSIFYDKGWKYVDSRESAQFVLSLEATALPRPGGSVYCSGNVTVDRISGENLVDLPVATAKR